MKNVPITNFLIAMCLLFLAIGILRYMDTAADNIGESMEDIDPVDRPKVWRRFYIICIIIASVVAILLILSTGLMGIK